MSAPSPRPAPTACRDPRGTYPECPLCGSVEGWQPEHAHFRCRSCGFRDSCCD
ncbi:MAG TPA: hypothetical protein VK866_14090 [Acidimicrobiales bacterium]|nr:hypothetical protein [Acidimicrobiales bacterium]